MKKLLLISILSMAGCGGGGSKPAKPEPEPTPTTTDTTAMEKPAEPAETKPAEPAPPPPPDPKVVAMEAETAAHEKAKPVFEKFCKSCHDPKGGRGATKKALGELDISAYPFKGEHANAKDIRKVLGIGGGKATMPKNKPGSVKGDDLAAISAWADAWDASESAGAHEAAAKE